MITFFSGPPPPTINGSNSDSDKIILDWSTSCTSCDEDRKADFYEVFYRTPEITEQSFQVRGRNSLSATIPNLQANTLYTVVVRITSGTIRRSSDTAYIRSDRSTAFSVTTGDLSHLEIFYNRLEHKLLY